MLPPSFTCYMHVLEKEIILENGPMAEKLQIDS